MKIYLSFDVGSISVKAALLMPKEHPFKGSDTFQPFSQATTEQKLFVSDYIRIQGDPHEIVRKRLDEIRGLFPNDEVIVTATGNGSNLVTEVTSAAKVNEFQAIAAAARAFHPQIRTILEMGGETSKYILLKEGHIVDYNINGDCAAGTGSFIDQQAERLGYSVEELGKIILSANKSAKIAGRCSVFAKSDMIHAQQKGYLPPEVLLGLSKAVARNFKATIVRGKKIESPVAFIGGLAKNAGVVDSLCETLDIQKNELLIPGDGTFWGAIGAALFTANAETVDAHISKLNEWATMQPLSTDRVKFLRDQIHPVELPDNEKTAVYLGIDVGSVSTNLVLLDETGRVVDDIYVSTRARPIEVVSDALLDIEKRLGDKIVVVGVGTTGSGRELVGELVGADTIRDEITAHKTGAISIAKTYLGDDVDTIFEIGGQDAKYIYIENGVVTNFAMNEACAAGTGSFLEEQANRMGISIKDEFAEKAFSSKAPLKLGERCTVFIERDINAYQLQGARSEDILGGLAFSIVTNYLNRVVGPRPIGDKIFFQGGTAYNDAVAAAFSQILGKEVVVPPHNGVIGAVGTALLAKDLVEQTGMTTQFKGFDLSKVDYSMREFTCNGCTNTCDIQEFNVEGKKTYWGDKCSEKFRTKSKTTKAAELPDLFALRDDILSDVLKAYPRRTNGRNEIIIGIPQTMYYWDQAPIWTAFLHDLGFTIVTSHETNKEIIRQGLEFTVSEPCYPIKVAHGHIWNLIDRGVDYVWLPNILNARREQTQDPDKIYYVCPWGMTLPFVIRNSKAFVDVQDKLLTPTLPYHYGKKAMVDQLKKFGSQFGISTKEIKRAIERGYEAEDRFRTRLSMEGDRIWKKVKAKNLQTVIVLGRPYNTLDGALNLNLAHRLRTQYGINVVPMDFVPTAGNAREMADNMFWNYGRRILKSIEFANRSDNLHLIYITNFKCGPDSYVKHYAQHGSDSPFLILQFDEHSNDAGFVTRIEANLDSKGLLTLVDDKKEAVVEKEKPLHGTTTTTKLGLIDLDYTRTYEE